ELNLEPSQNNFPGWKIHFGAFQILLAPFEIKSEALQIKLERQEIPPGSRQIPPDGCGDPLRSLENPAGSFQRSPPRILARAGGAPEPSIRGGDRGRGRRRCGRAGRERGRGEGPYRSACEALWIFAISSRVLAASAPARSP